MRCCTVLCAILMSGCFSYGRVHDDAFEAATAMCPGSDSEATHPLVYRDQRGRARVAEYTTAEGGPTGNALLIDAKTQVRRGDHWFQFCHGNWEREDDRQEIRLRRSDPNMNAGIAIGLGLTAMIIATPVLILALVGFHL